MYSQGALRFPAQPVEESSLLRGPAFLQAVSTQPIPSVHSLLWHSICMPVSPNWPLCEDMTLLARGTAECPLVTFSMVTAPKVKLIHSYFQFVNSCCVTTCTGSGVTPTVPRVKVTELKNLSWPHTADGQLGHPVQQHRVSFFCRRGQLPPLCSERVLKALQGSPVRIGQVTHHHGHTFLISS